MSNILKALQGVGAEDKLYVDDVFQSYVRTGTGASASITTGFRPDLVWVKRRNDVSQHTLSDTAHSVPFSLQSNTTNGADTANTMVASFDTSGYTIGSNSTVNTNLATYIDWVFKKSPKFFDVVTYTGNGVAGRTIAHSLGVAPGMMIVKRTDSTGNWNTWHRASTAGSYLWLNSTNAADTAGAATYFGNNSITIDPTSSVFTVGTANEININGGTFVAYLFAHDTTTDGIVQCGSYVGNGSAAGPTITLGWEPQYLMVKGATNVIDWQVVDSMRGITDSNTVILEPNTSDAERSTGDSRIKVNATGFAPALNTNEFNATGQTYIYLAIRRPNKPPTVGTQVYACDNSFGSDLVAPAFRSGFPVDLAIYRTTNGSVSSLFVSRSTGEKSLNSSSTAAESTFVDHKFDYMNGWYSSATSLANYVSWMFKRAPGVFDVVCYTGTGSATTVAHSLGAVPELMIVKNRTDAQQWLIYSAALGASAYLRLNSSDGSFSGTQQWNGVAPTTTIFSVGTSAATNGSTNSMVAYLFSTKAGISYVGSYTGNGSTQTINCGFTTGARFVLIKRTDSTGDWFVWDTVRGIVAGNDPHLSLNTTAAEVTTDDSIDADTSGFVVNQDAATNINVNLASYIVLSMA